MSEKRGLTLVGLTIVAVAVGLLTAAATADFTRMGDGAKIDRVKANMCTIQLAFEDFAVRTDGVYPTAETDVTPGGRTVVDLLPDWDGDGNGEWPINPFTGCETVFTWNADPCNRGDISANPATAACYTIKGCGRDGNLLLFELTSCGPRRVARQSE